MNVPPSMTTQITIYYVSKCDKRAQCPQTQYNTNAKRARILYIYILVCPTDRFTTRGARCHVNGMRREMDAVRNFKKAIDVMR